MRCERVRPKNDANLTFRAHPFHGIPIGFAYGYAHKTMRLPVGTREGIEREVRGFDSFPVFDDAIEFAMFSNPVFSLHNRKREK